MIKDAIKRMMGIKDKKETRQRDFEWERFQRQAKEQFQRLKDKGISIPVVTL